MAPPNPLELLKQALATAAKGDVAATKADFDKAIRFEHPEPARVYFAEALTYERLERPENAKESLGKALAANPDLRR